MQDSSLIRTSQARILWDFQYYAFLVNWRVRMRVVLAKRNVETSIVSVLDGTDTDKPSFWRGPDRA